MIGTSDLEITGINKNGECFVSNNFVGNNPNINGNINLNPTPEVNQNINSNDSFFIPASEQTPRFEPREVSIPKPVEPEPIINNQVNSIPSPVVEPAEVHSIPNINMNQNVVPQMVPPTAEPVVDTPNVAPVMPNSAMPTDIPTMAVPNSGINVAPIPNATPNNINPGVIPNANMQSVPVAEPMNQMNSMQNVVPNVNPLPQETANNMNQNSNYMQGGSTFVMNGQVPNNQNNNNWNL